MLTMFIPPVRYPFNDFISIESTEQGIVVAVFSGIFVVSLIFLIISFFKNNK